MSEREKMFEAKFVSRNGSAELYIRVMEQQDRSRIIQIEVCSGSTKMDIVINSDTILRFEERMMHALKEAIKGVFRRHGKPWDEEEEQNLVGLLHQGKNVDELSVVLQRTPKAIVSKIMMMGLSGKMMMGS